MSDQSQTPDVLRVEAGKRLSGAAPAGLSLPNFVHELQVHQIELEMQNETLRQTQLELEESRERYKDLYDFAPVAYLTLDQDGVISESNFAAAGLLGVERRQLLGHLFLGYVAEEDAERWQRYLLSVLLDDGPQLAELMLRRHDGVVFYAGFEGRCVNEISVRITFHDTTQRRLAEQALVESNAKLSLFINYAPSAIAMFDSEMRYIAYSRRWVSDYGLVGRRDLTGQSHYEVFPDLPERWRDIYRRCLAGAIEKCEEHPFPRADGTVDWVRWEIHPWRNGIGDIAGIIIFSEVITARVQAEHRLRESEEKFRVIFDGAIDGILLLDSETGRFVSANPAFCTSIGCEWDELIDFGVADIHPAEDLSWIIEDIQRHVSGETRMSVDIPVLRRDGSIFYVDIKSAPVVLHGKNYLVGIFRDTSTHRELEALRRSSELKHRLLFEASHDALMTLTPPSWKFSGVNQAAMKLFGAGSSAQLLDYEPWGMSPEFQSDGALSVDKALMMIEIAMSTGSNFFEWLHQRIDGTPFFAEVLLTRIDLGTEVFIQATVRDITNRRQADHALRESQQLLRELAAQSAASREAELKNVAREVHDELGQILTAVRMDVSLLRMQFGEQNPELLKKIQDMKALVDKAIQGVRDVTVNLRPPALDMGLVSALSWLCNDFNSRSRIDCSLRVIDHPRELTETQTVVIFRIVQESLTNVARHAAATRVEIILKQSCTGIDIAVQDDGEGFDAELQPAKKSFGLLGMKERALAVNGRVNVVSSLGNGTVISVYIPFDCVRPMRRRSDDTPANS